MKINVIVNGPLYSSQCGYSAIEFCNAAVNAGHTISQVFFYQDGVSQSSRLSRPLEDEFDSVEKWIEFSHKHAVPLLVCVSAGERRAIVSDQQAQEQQLGSGCIHSGFEVAGLGLMHEASLNSDRTVTFK